MFFRNEIDPYTVSDKVKFRNCGKKLVMHLRSDAPTMMINLRQAEAKLSSVSGKSSPEEITEAARFFAVSVFGDEGEKLMDFYGEPLAVISAVRIYFDKRLKYKITKAQEK